MCLRSLLSFIGLVASLTLAGDAAAQRADSLPVGARVRVHRQGVPQRVVSGLLLRSDSTGLTLAAANSAPPWSIAATEVVRLERHAGRRSAAGAFGRGAGRGALVGLALSAVLLGAVLVEEQRNPSDSFISAPVAAGIVAVPLTAGSILIGGVIGLGRRDRWTRVAYPEPPAVDPPAR
jgi:hypothetical protein